jgi:hypothetical protein
MRALLVCLEIHCINVNSCERMKMLLQNNKSRRSPGRDGPILQRHVQFTLLGDYLIAYALEA